MKIHIVTIGSPKLDYAKIGFAEYIKRLGRYHTVRVSHMPDKQNTATHIAEKIGNGYSIALVIDGPQLSNHQLAELLEKRSQLGQELCFIIGGPDGLPAEIITAANQQFSMSKLTFPHDLAMLVLAETLYRSSTINANYPYHH